MPSMIKYTISFRKATVLDVDFLVLLRKLSMTTHLANAGIHMTDEQHKSRVLEHYEDSNIISLNEQPIGLLKLGHLDESLHIRQFQLLPNYQGRGIGEKVLGMTIGKARTKKKPVTLCVLLDNLSLIHI